jgi:hypothetical protein
MFVHTIDESHIVISRFIIQFDEYLGLARVCGLFWLMRVCNALQVVQLFEKGKQVSLFSHFSILKLLYMACPGRALWLSLPFILNQHEPPHHQHCALAPY